MTLPRRSFLGLALPSALALSGCGEPSLPKPQRISGNTPAPRKGGTLRYSLWGDLPGLDSTITTDMFAFDALNLLHDTLVDFSPATAKSPLEIVPQLATAWSTSNGGATLTFKLREDARFSNGEPVLAEDFVYSIERLLDPKLSSPYGSFFNGILGAKDRLGGKIDRVPGARALSDKVLEIRLEEPDPSFLPLLTLRNAAPLKRSHVEAAGDRIREAPLGTGPFALRRWEEGRRIAFERNPHYWNRERPYLDGIAIDVNVPLDTANLRFLRGEYDTLYDPPTGHYLRFASSPEWQPYIDRSVMMTSLSLKLNTNIPPLGDKRVRQALNYAIDKEAWRRLLNGRLVIANGFVPEGIPGHDPHRKPYPFDPEKARRLLSEAGLSGGFDLVYTFSKQDAADPISESIQADLAAVGIRMRIDVVTSPALYSAVFSGEVAMSNWSWLMDFPVPWNFLEPNFHSRMAPPSGANFSFYSNPQFDRLLDEARHEPDPERSVALYRKAEEILMDDCPAVWVGYPVLAEVRQPYVRGYKYHPCRWRCYRDAWLDKEA